MALSPDPNLEQFCTPHQWKILQTYWAEGSDTKAAAKLGCCKRLLYTVREAVKKKAARAGYSPEHDMTRMVPDGFHLKGTSTLYDGAGEIRAQWVKSSIDHDRQMEIMREAVEAMAETLPRVKPVKPPKTTADDLMACFPVGDHHIGLHVWHEEGGGDYDLKISEGLLSGAFDYLMGVAPPCAQAAIMFMGDLMHRDSVEPVTPTNRNILDVDSRFPKMVRVTIRCVRYAVRAALERHGHVHVIIEPGNHDLSSSILLAESLAVLYENEPRVTIDTSPRHFHYLRFGKVLLGTHHGHGVKMADLPMVMATDRPQDWGETTFRHWWVGHIHHQRERNFGSQDFTGCTVESFRVLPPNDAWHDKRGYRPLRDMKCIVFDREDGEIERHAVNPGMLLRG